MRRLDDDSPTDDTTPDPADPRDVQATRVGTPIRDAAVDPRPEDFLPPVNAGEANPHGPRVVSPEIHASQGLRPVKPGDVHTDDTDAQQDAETAHAVAATDGTPVDDADVYRDEQPDAGKPAPGASELKGQALDDALEAAGLPKTGSADEKRARLAEHQG